MAERWLKDVQKKMGKDIEGLKDGQVKMEKDIEGLKDGQVKMGKDIVEIREDITEIKVDITDLKQGQHNMDHMMLKLLEEMTSVKKIVINMENDLCPKVKTLFDADKIRQHDTTELQQICRGQEKRIEDHELRITRLEQ
jgi:chromosome segregation ATPase